MGEYLRFGETNTIKVLAISDNLSSRWYPGSGIYRNVNLMIGALVHIVPDGVKVTTEEIEDGMATVRIETVIHCSGNSKKRISLLTQFADDGSKNAAEDQIFITVKGDKEYHITQRLTIPDPKLWDVDDPNLYHCISKIYDGDEELDKTDTITGIRKLSLDAVHGLRLNGKTVKLRGACIHHDNGIIGACTLEKAEEFRCRKLKEAGFNSIRSAHNPMSKEMLSACDRLGMLVMDELTDMWMEPKNPHDFAAYFEEHWEDEVKRMVDKDYNHPSVVLCT